MLRAPRRQRCRKNVHFQVDHPHEQPTQGTITIEGMDVVKDFAKCRKLIGYCP
jgi:hypothetical protein